eukprot:TRINITY_DN169_c0_g5_i1.p1 TRINITY_DN169_c0_g5~~TRINITY_DN169_c0_g5_i1.p1  ORF type:complete len:139 (-),score=41.08 TRINITY_DN169_c0_g5_i1:642-1058(-)
MSKTFTWEEVKQHANRNSLWFVYKGKVLDVTAFLDEHPGGDEIIIERGGKDGTQEFDDIGHSKEAYDMLNKYVIGTLEGAEAVEEKPAAKAETKPAASITPADASKADAKDTSSPLVFNVAVTACVLVAAFAVRHYFK